MNTVTYTDLLKVVNVIDDVVKLEDGSSHSLSHLETICDHIGYEIKELRGVTDFSFLYGQSIRFRIVNGKITDIQFRHVRLKVKK